MTQHSQETTVNPHAADVHFEELEEHPYTLLGAIGSIARLLRHDSHRLLTSDIPPAPADGSIPHTEKYAHSNDTRKPVTQPQMDLGIEELPQR